MDKRAVLYARVSGDDRGMDGRNLKGQLDMCREYAERQGWHVAAELAEDERGVSGARLDAPQLNKAIDLAAAGHFDILVVREIDRLARDVGKQYLVEGELKRHGVKIAYVLGEYPDSPEGDLQKAIKAAIASYERTKIAERSTRGRRREAKRGSTLVHGRVPFGYDLIHNGDKYQLTINESQAEIVRLIFAWYTGPERLAIRRICDKLNEAGIAAPRGGSWQHGQVRRMLTSETYAGRWYYGKYNKAKGGTPTTNDPANWILVNVPALVDGDTWGIAQERRSSNKALSARNIKRDYLLRGRARCGACGWQMRLAIGSGGHRYYRCGRLYDNSAPQPCDHKTHYRQDLVDAIAWAWVKQLIYSPERLEKGWHRYQAAIEIESAPIRAQLAIVEEGIEKHKGQLAKILDLYLTEAIDKDILMERRERLQSTVESLEAQRAELEGRLAGRAVTQHEFMTMQRFIGELAARLDVGIYEGDLERMQQVIDLLDVKATLMLEGGERVIYLEGRLGKEAFIVEPITANEIHKNTADMLVSSRIVLGDALAAELFTMAITAPAAPFSVETDLLK